MGQMRTRRIAILQQQLNALKEEHKRLWRKKRKAIYRERSEEAKSLAILEQRLNKLRLKESRKRSRKDATEQAKRKRSEAERSYGTPG